MISLLTHNLYVATFCSSIFASLFILLRQFFLKSIGARWSYYLWFIIFIPWFAVWLPLSFLPEIESKFNFQIITASLDIPQQLRSISLHSKIHLTDFIFICWLSGSFLYLIYILLRHFRFVYFLKNNSFLLTVAQQEVLKNILPNKHLISLKRILLSSGISSPMICHIVRSRIYLPDNFFENYTPAEQKYILQHECVHYQRCDMIANTAMLGLICLNWFNPILFLSYRYFRYSQELSCDAILSQQFSSSEIKAYGYALVKSAFYETSQALAMTCSWNTGKQLKERCLMLKFHHSKPMKNFLGLVILALSASLAIAAPNLEKRDQAGSMKIANSSKNALTFKINHVCSRLIGEIAPHSVKVISRLHLNAACAENPEQCKAQVYSSSNCTGKLIVSLTLDMSSGVISIIPRSDDYHISGNGFNLFFDGPWV